MGYELTSTHDPSEAVMSCSASTSSFKLTTDPPIYSQYLHPSVSRLRSSVNHASQNRTAPSVTNFEDHHHTSFTPSVNVSRASSVNGIDGIENPTSQEDRVGPFRWTTLRHVSEYLFPQALDKARAILGTAHVGHPSVLAANGLICVGTVRGLVLVFDFQQRLKCICGDENSCMKLYWYNGVLTDK